MIPGESGITVVIGSRARVAIGNGATHVAASVQCDSEDPSLEVLDAAHLVAVSPALEERLLQGIARVLGVTNHVEKRAQQLSLPARKGGIQRIAFGPTVGLLGLGGWVSQVHASRI